MLSTEDSIKIDFFSFIGIPQKVAVNQNSEKSRKDIHLTAIY